MLHHSSATTTVRNLGDPTEAERGDHEGARRGLKFGESYVFVRHVRGANVAGTEQHRGDAGDLT